ncbi:hypothetical protein N9O79_02540 [Luminiphilus sp.]|nr:hypothetical protein [Luminiphilus sp.]
MTKPLLAILLSLPLLVGGCASSTEMMDIEPAAEFEAKAKLPEFRDCLFRWSSSRAVRLEYHPDGIFVKDSVGGPMYLIAHQLGTVKVFIHWNLNFGKDLPVYMAGRCNDDVSAMPPEDLWSMFFDRESLPQYGRYLPQM